MSKRFAGIASLLVLFVFNAHAETGKYAQAMEAEARVVVLGDSGWELFRPSCREMTPFDLTYLTNHLRSERAGFGVRFHSSTHLTLDLEIDPFTQQRNLIGPVYDFGVGATTLALRFRF